MPHQTHTVPTSSSIPTISVFGTEVPLPLYFQAVDLYDAGHNVDGILVHIVATNHISNIDTLRETVQNIILNVQLINNPSQMHTLLIPCGDEERTSRRHSRIEFVGELDDLNSAQLVAEDKRRKEKERRTLKQFLAKLG